MYIKQTGVADWWHGTGRVGASQSQIKSQSRNMWIRDVFCYRIPAYLAPTGPTGPTNTWLESGVCDREV